MAELLEANGVEALKWMNLKGYITPTQYNSAFDNKGYLSAEAKEDLKGVLYQSIFRDGSTSLKSMFDILPSKAQKAILATAWRDHDSPESERMTGELQNSFSAYHAVSTASKEFRNAKSYEEAVNALEDWKRQSRFDDSTGETYYPAEKYSNFALTLAAMYKGQKQSFIQGTFNRMYDLIQGTQQGTLFESPDNTPRTLAEAIKETLNIDYNGQNGSNTLAGDSTASQRGGRGGSTNAQPGERAEEGEQPADSGAGVETVRGGRGDAGDTSRRQPLGAPQANGQEEIDENGLPFVISPDGTTKFGEVTEDTGLNAAPIKLSQGVVDDNGDGYRLRHIEARHGSQIRNAGFTSVEDFVKFVAENYDKDNIKVGKRRTNGSGTFVIQAEDEHSNLLYIELSRDGSYWNVNSGGVFRKGYAEKKKNVERNTEHSTSATAAQDKSFVQTDPEEGRASADTHSDNQRLSESKDSASSGTNKENPENNKVKPQKNGGYTLEKRFSKAKNKDVWVIRFDEKIKGAELDAQKVKAKQGGGWYYPLGKEFIFTAEENARKFADTIMSEKSNPVTLEDLRSVSQSGDEKAEKMEEKPEQKQDEIGKTTKEEPKTAEPENVPEQQRGTAGDSEGTVREQQRGTAGDSEGTVREQQLKPVNPSGNKLVTDERYEELKRRMREKLKGQMNMGIDPEILAIGKEMALYHLEKGTRKFVEYAKAMIADLGDVVRPYLKAFYNGARDLPEVAGTDIEKGMTSYEEVRSIDVANFDKQTIDAAATAETVAREQEVEDEAERAKEKIREEKETKKQETEQKKNEEETGKEKQENVSSEDGKNVTSQQDTNIKENENGKETRESVPDTGTGQPDDGSRQAENASEGDQAADNVHDVRGGGQDEGARGGSSGERAPVGAAAGGGRQDVDPMGGGRDDGGGLSRVSAGRPDVPSRLGVRGESDKRRDSREARGAGRGRAGEPVAGEPSGQPRERVEKKKGAAKGSDDRVSYSPTSSGQTCNSVMPALQAKALYDSLHNEKFGGDIDQYVTDKLGYKDKNELYDHLSAEQIEGVALAIAQLDAGSGFILGDMTGVGKGRQGAAIIRYAVRRGLKPVYFTAKPQLFSDVYRDLTDIGSGELKPFIFASTKDGDITTADDDDQLTTVHAVPSSEEFDGVMKSIGKSGKLPDDYDFVLCTYSQVQNGTNGYAYVGGKVIKAEKSFKSATARKAAENGERRRNAIEYLSRGTIAIFDESHLAAGESDTGVFLQKCLENAKGSVFMSATFAKRPDNMPLYAQNTGLSESGLPAGDLVSAVTFGGLPLQEVMSQQLVMSGQMVRRERDFSGVSIDWRTCAKNSAQKQRTQYNSVASILQRFLNIERTFIKPAMEVAALLASKKKLKVTRTPMSSILFPMFNQVMFSLKAEEIAQTAIAELQQGRKPVISYYYTADSAFEKLDEGGKNI